jgi:hypothetical protein
MGILQFTTDEAGQIGQNPRRVKIVTTDNLSTVTAAGYLNKQGQVLQGFSFYPTDIIDMIYSYSVQSNSGTYEMFTISISNSVITLTAFVSVGNVLLPVTSGDFAVFNGTSGQIKDAGYLPSNAAKTNVVMANGATIANHIAVYTDIAGTAGIDAATAINGGNIQAGLSGTAGTLASFPGTASKGSLVVAAVANTGNTNITISNAAHGQATTYSIQDIGGAAGNLLNSVVGKTLFFAQVAAGGSGQGPFTISTTGSPVGYAFGQLLSSSNPVAVSNIGGGVAGQVTVTFTGDPGAAAQLQVMIVAHS